MSDEHEMDDQETFEAELASRLASAADGVGRTPSRDAVSAAVVHLQARQRRVRRVGALAAAAVVLVAGGVAAAAVSGDDGSVQVASGSSTTTPGCPDDLTGEQRYERGDPRCGDPACIEPAALVMEGVQVAYGYDWGIDVATGEVRILDRPFGPDGVPRGLVALTPAQGVYLFDDGLLDPVSVPAGSTVAVRLTAAMAQHLAEHEEPVTVDQLTHLRPPPAAGDVLRMVVPAEATGDPTDGCPDGVGVTDTPEATTSTTVPATTTSTSTSTTTTVPETTTTTVPIPPKPPELSTFTEGGEVWAVYVGAFLLGPDYMDSVEVWEGEGEGAQLIRYGYRGLANPIDCDQGADVAFPDYVPDGRNTGYVVGAYFASSAEAEAFAANYPHRTWGPVAVRTTCVAQPFPGTGQTRDTDQGEVLD